MEILFHFLVCSLPVIEDNHATTEEYVEDANNSKDDEDDESSMAKLYQQVDIVIISYSIICNLLTRGSDSEGYRTKVANRNQSKEYCHKPNST